MSHLYRLRNLPFWMLILSFAIAAHCQTSPECNIDGITEGQLTIEKQINISDIARGNTFSGATEITEYYVIPADCVTTPYIGYRIEDGNFIALLLDTFEDYEQNEYLTTLVNNINFPCQLESVSIYHNIIDTNNHPPVLMSDETISISLPLNAGVYLPGDIIVRDVDLTTQKILFELEESDFFDIVHVEHNENDRKNFHARLVTKRLIISLDQPIQLSVTATDSDLTGDPPLTTQFSLTITVDPKLSFPTTPTFGRAYHRGRYLTSTGLYMQDTIEIIHGYDANVRFDLSGDDSSYFTCSNNGGVVNLAVIEENPIPESITELTFTIFATRMDEEVIRGVTAVFISVPVASFPPTVNKLQFTQNYYIGTIEHGRVLTSPAIHIAGGRGPNVILTILNEQKDSFEPTLMDNEVTIHVFASFAAGDKDDTFLNIELEASEEGSISAITIITVDLTKQIAAKSLEFTKTVYEGSYNPTFGLQLTDDISLFSGFNPTVIFDIVGDHATYFVKTQKDNYVELTVAGEHLPPNILEDNTDLIFLVVAMKGIKRSSAAVHILLPSKPIFSQTLTFASDIFEGRIENGLLTLGNIILGQGFDKATDVQFEIEGKHKYNFYTIRAANVVTVSIVGALPNELLLTNTNINLILRATAPNYNSASTVIVLAVIPPDTPVFSEVIYAGSYHPNTGLLLENEIYLSQGSSDKVVFSLDGSQSEFFTLKSTGNSVELQPSETITEVVIKSNDFLMFSLLASREGTDGGSAAVVITLSSDGSEEPITETPKVAFTSGSYSINILASQTGLIGRVTARATTGERLTYTLLTATEQLKPIIMIGSSNGQVLLMSPANPGVYEATVTATTANTQVLASADLIITVKNVIVDNYALKPLTILEREEEQAYDDLLPLNIVLADVCHYVITNSWPAGQDWFYINENGGLSMKAVDREHPTIAHIHSSQVQIELALICDNVENVASQMTTLIRHARDVENTDFGNRNWIITNEIQYSTRHAVVNVIITDINDNEPVFTVRGNVTSVVGYPDADTVGSVLPPFFAKVEAKDADIGINAEILYSTKSELFSIHPDTGVMYLMPEALSTLTDGLELTVEATDQYGKGHTTSLNLKVLLLSLTQIASLRISNAFLENESNIISTLSEQLNLDIRSLGAVVVPNSPSNPGEDSRTADRTRRASLSANMPTLTIHVYALNNDNELLDASNIVESISSIENSNWEISSAVLAASGTVTALNRSASAFLLTTTIVLTILLIGLVGGFAIRTWYRRLNRYQTFTDAISTRSGDENITGSALSAMPSDKNQNIPSSSRSTRFDTFDNNPMVRDLKQIQIPMASLIDFNSGNVNDDEFNEVQRRKSDVTFNELVEQINIERHETDSPVRFVSLSKNTDHVNIHSDC